MTTPYHVRINEHLSPTTHSKVEAEILAVEARNRMPDATVTVVPAVSASFAAFLADAGLDESGAETLIRLAVCLVVDGYNEQVLFSFSEPDAVEALARRAEKLIYPEGN